MARVLPPTFVETVGSLDRPKYELVLQHKKVKKAENVCFLVAVAVHSILQLYSHHTYGGRNSVSDHYSPEVQILI